jgi:hypothetical protein
MNRDFDYTQRILVAVEFGQHPRQPAGLPDTHAVFRRIAIPEVLVAFRQQVPAVARFFAGRKFRQVLDQRMGYWESRIPAGDSCFVHYVRGTSAVVEKAKAAFTAAGNWVSIGIYHVEPQSSAYPFGFPFGSVPDHWFHGQTHDYSDKSVFWFNFFPAQKFLFEKTFVIWALFNLFKSKEGGVSNQLVAADDPDQIEARGTDRFVQVNLNRFTSIEGYFTSARAAGQHTFTGDTEYTWYGMLLRNLTR